MNQTAVFSSGLELKAFVTSSANLLLRSWNAISSSYEDINSNEEVSWTVLEESDLNIIAFVTPPDYTQHPLQADLVSSSELREKDHFTHFEFLCSESNPLFSVNKAAVYFFQENCQKLDQLKSIIKSSTPLIVTGHAFGGLVASLFTLSLIDSNGSVKKRPLCITFGSPLIGDKNMQQAISRSSTWNSCFLHVVSHKDPLPGLFITSHRSSASQSSPQTQTGAYIPFGTFLFCSDAGSTCSEDPDSILELLVAMGSIHDQNEGLQSADYGSIVKNLYSKAICKDFAAGAEHMTHSNSLEASISLQLLALGFAPHMQQHQQNIDINTLVAKMQEAEISQKTDTFDPKILTDKKIYMAQLERYMEDSKNRGIGYYDSFKIMPDVEALWARDSLTSYWKNMVEEAEMKPRKEGKALRKRWLLGGNNYRRMVEPLDIAQFYKGGGKNYVTENRSKHYRRLEESLNEGTTTTTGGRQHGKFILTVDSCFWAHVEEALISCEQLKAVEPNVTEKEQASKKLLEFEEYVYRLLKNYEVSPEIFLEQSSYMRWWNEYKAIKGTSYNSTLAGFMSNPINYEQYAMGAYDFGRGLINHLIREFGLEV